jgi:hypothetical protein
MNDASAPDFQDDAPDGYCEECDAPMDADELNVEAFEMTGKLLCADCAAEALGED